MKPKYLRLRRKSRASPWRSLLLRVLLVIGLVALAVAVHWFDRAGLKDNHDGAISFVDVLYFTAITVTTVGYGDIVPVTDQARMFDTFVVTPIRIFIWLIFVGTAYEFLFKRLWDRWRMQQIQRTLAGHIVVAGFGTVGEEAVRELIERDCRCENILVIDQDEAAHEHAREIGATVLQADATRDASLQSAKIEEAAALIVAVGRDDTAILIVLTARALAPALPISVVIRSEDNEPLARRAGATTVINPASFAGLLLAGATQGPHVADYLADLAGARGEVRLRERPVRREEVGQPLDTLTTGLGVRIDRDGGRFGYWQPEARVLQDGDVIVEIVPLR